MLNENDFKREYLGTYPPQTFLGWIEDLADQLECPPPDANCFPRDPERYFTMLGAWETQHIILTKLRYAVKIEKERLERK